MPYQLQVIKTSDFVKLDKLGKIDLARTRQALEDVARACVERGMTCALLDARAAHGDLSMADLYHLAGVFQAMGFRRDHRLAILHRKGGEKAGFFATCASNRGWNVQAFDEFEQAMEWFSTELPVE